MKCAYSLNRHIKLLGLRLSRNDCSDAERVEALGMYIHGEVIGDKEQQMDLVQ